MFIASEEHILCWGQILLALEMNAFHAGDEYISAGDERVVNKRTSFSHTHTQTQLATSNFQAEFMLR